MSYAVESIHIHKKLRLDKRAGSDNWYARLTLPNGKRLIKTTKTEDLESAKEVALRLYYEVDARIQNKLPATTRKFADVAKHAIARMETEIREGVGKQAYRDYTQALNKWLIPYFGGTDIAKIDLAAVTRFDAWRTAQSGKVPAQSTINNHNSALNRVFRTSLDRGWINEYQIPQLKNKGDKTQRRPHFEKEELMKENYEEDSIYKVDWNRSQNFQRPWVEMIYKDLHKHSGLFYEINNIKLQMSGFCISCVKNKVGKYGKPLIVLSESNEEK